MIFQLSEITFTHTEVIYIRKKTNKLHSNYYLLDKKKKSMYLFDEGIKNITWEFLVKEYTMGLESFKAVQYL